ncbi:MAG: Na+/H+ antiporter subunit E [Pseudomonadota bacterium]
MSAGLRLGLIAGTLYAFWLLLSGNYQAWLVLSGLGASVLVVWFCLKKGVVDGEGFPVEDLPRALSYWPWLIGQIVLSSLAVTRLILNPKLPISPTMVAVEAPKGASSVGLTTYANSITLTPGTISVEVGERAETVWVHAITQDGAAGLENDPMKDWVAWMDGGEWPGEKALPAPEEATR